MATALTGFRVPLLERLVELLGKRAIDLPAGELEEGHLREITPVHGQPSRRAARSVLGRRVRGLRTARLLALASVVVARSGADTISELTALVSRPSWYRWCRRPVTSRSTTRCTSQMPEPLWHWCKTGRMPSSCA